MGECRWQTPQLGVHRQCGRPCSPTREVLKHRQVQRLQCDVYAGEWTEVRQRWWPREGDQVRCRRRPRSSETCRARVLGQDRDEVVGGSAQVAIHLLQLRPQVLQLRRLYAHLLLLLLRGGVAVQRRSGRHRHLGSRPPLLGTSRCLRCPEGGARARPQWGEPACGLQERPHDGPGLLRGGHHVNHHRCRRRRRGLVPRSAAACTAPGGISSIADR